MLNNDFAVVILAGGRSERLGEPKGLVSVLGKPWLNWQRSVLSAVTNIPPILVVGFHKDAYEMSIDESNSWDIICNPSPEFGPFSSLQVGVAHALQMFPHLTGIFVLPVDTPGPIASVWHKLAAQIRDGKTLAAIPTREKSQLGNWEQLEVRPARSGHPACLSRTLCQKIMSLDKSSTTARLDYIFAGLTQEQKAYVEVVDCRSFINLNTKLEWSLFAPILTPNVETLVLAKQRQRASAICIHNNCLLLITAREPHSGIVVGFAPGGEIEPEETPAEAAVRETKEETGFMVEVSSPSTLMARYYFPWKGIMYDSTTHFIPTRLLPNDHHRFLPDDAAIEGFEWCPILQLKSKLSFFTPQLVAIEKLLLRTNN